MSQPDLSEMYTEARCAICSDAIAVLVDLEGPHFCGLHTKERSMKKRKKKDFSEAIAASAEQEPKPKKNGNANVRTESVVLRKVKHRLPVRIDDATAAAKGEQLAEVCEQRLAVKAQRRERMAEFKETLAGLDERERELSASVKQHTETRDVLCAERLTPQNEVEIVRLDTGEIASTRPAEAKDLQPELFEKAGKGGAEWTEGANPAPKGGKKANQDTLDTDAIPF